jgi:hypothetical protein
VFLNRFGTNVKGDVRAEIAQLFKYTPLFQPFIILDLYLQHTESLTEIVRLQALSARTNSPSTISGPYLSSFNFPGPIGLPTEKLSGADFFASAEVSGYVSNIHILPYIHQF